MGAELSPKIKKLVAKQMTSGRYKSETAVLLDALQLLDVRNDEFDVQLASMRNGVRRGLADAAAGRMVPIESVTVESIRALAKTRVSQRRLRKSA